MKLFALLTMDILEEDRLLTGFTVTGWVCLQKKYYGEKSFLQHQDLFQTLGSACKVS